MTADIHSVTKKNNKKMQHFPQECCIPADRLPNGKQNSRKKPIKVITGMMPGNYWAREPGIFPDIIEGLSLG